MAVLLILTLTILGLFIFIFFIKYHIFITLLALVIPLVIGISNLTLYTNIYLVINSYWSYCLAVATVQLLKPSTFTIVIVLKKLTLINLYKKLLFILFI